MKRLLPPYHPHVDDAALGRLLTRFDVSLMNNAKWVRLIEALSAEPDVVHLCFAKLVWSDEAYRFHVAGSVFNFDYYADSMEARIAVRGDGWHRYKEIEWLQFPPFADILVDTNNRSAGFQRVEQDLKTIRARIESVGGRDLHEDSDGLRLYAYRKLQP